MIELKNQKLHVQLKRAGAELCSIRSVATNTEYLWQADKSVWARHAPVLFPIVGKLKNDSYVFEGKKYSLSQHGFARDKEFNMVEKDDTKAVFELRDDEASREVYPFRFKLQIEYALEGSKLSCTYKVVNPDQKQLYFSIGAHPGFNCSLSDKSFIEFEQPEIIDRWLIHDGLISDKTEKVVENSTQLKLNSSLFDKDAIVIKHLNSKLLTLNSELYSMKFSWYNMPYFGIWSKPGTNKFICIEPWAGIADSINASGNLMDKEGIICLKENEDYTCGFSVEF